MSLTINHRVAKLSTRLTRRQTIERELSLMEARVKNLVDAIAQGEEVTPLLAKLKAEEARKKDLVTELDRLNQPADLVNYDETRLKREIRQRITDAKGLLDCQRPEARQILRRLLDQPLQFEAYEDEGGKKGYKVTGMGSYLQLLPSPLVSPCVVSPTGFEPVLPA